MDAPIQWQTGDLLAFSGRSLASRVVQVATCSAISHVGAVAFVQPRHLQPLAKRGVITARTFVEFAPSYLLLEATTLNKSPCLLQKKLWKGGQAQRPEQKIKSYPGTVTLYRLAPFWSERFAPADQDAFVESLLADVGVPYDLWRALLSATCLLKRTLPGGGKTKRFCDESAAVALMRARLLGTTPPEDFTPGSLITHLVRSEVYERWGQLR